MPKFFVNKNQINGDNINIIGEDVKHIKKVLRYNVGDAVDICDGEGLDYSCIIDEMNENDIKASVMQSKKSETEPDTKVVIYQSLPKGDKMEYLIQKAVELGVHAIVPVASKNCVVKLDDKKAAKKIERWNKISESAAKQSGRSIIPEVRNILTFDEAIKAAEQDELKFVLYECEKKLTIHDIFDINKVYKNVSVFIGPEGGYTQKEIDKAISSDIKSVTLGKRILRTETVSTVILSIIMYNMGEI